MASANKTLSDWAVTRRACGATQVEMMRQVILVLGNLRKELERGLWVVADEGWRVVSGRAGAGAGHFEESGGGGVI